MKEQQQDLLLMKSIIKAELTNQELKIVYYMLSKPEKTVVTPISHIAKELKIAQPNTQRTFKNLIEKNVIGERGNGYFVKAKTAWRAKK